MKTNALLSISIAFSLVCRAEDPRSTPIPTPPIIILETKRVNLENSRVCNDKSYGRGEIDKAAHDKGMQDYKEGIAKYHSEARAIGADKEGSKSGGDKGGSRSGGDKGGSKSGGDKGGSKSGGDKERSKSGGDKGERGSGNSGHK